MDFKAQAIRELKEFRLKKQAVRRLEERIAILQSSGDPASLAEACALPASMPPFPASPPSPSSAWRS